MIPPREEELIPDPVLLASVQTPRLEVVVEVAQRRLTQPPESKRSWPKNSESGSMRLLQTSLSHQPA